MKRILYFLLLVLMMASSFGTAEAATRKKQPKKPAVTVDRDNGGDRDGDNGRPKRGPNIKKQKKASDGDLTVTKPGPIPFVAPIEMQLKRAASKRFDVRALPARRPTPRERPEHEGPEPNPVEIENNHLETPEPSIPGVQPAPNPPAPPPIAVYEGLDREFWGAGSPPDTTGDVGPTYYIQAVNTSIGIYDKSGVQQAAFTFDTLMAQGNFGNQCDTENFGDPVVLYDTFEDRWILTDFAFTLDGGGNVNPPIAFQCFAVSMDGNPLTGGWNFYSIAVTDALNDYPKLGVWTDGIYMSANLFGFPAGSLYQGFRVWAFNKQQMYAGSPTVQVVAFNGGTGDFTVVPSNARLQTGTPPPGRPNLFVSSWNFLNALTIYKFHVDWTTISLSTFTGPDTPLAATSWPNSAVANAPQPGTGTLLDVLQIRPMVQNTYTNFGGTESLWVPHTVRRALGGFAAPRWYQVDVSGGTVAANLPQAATWDPDAANVLHRFMPSLALDRAGNMAMGYSTSSTTVFPSIAYAGRLAADPINTFSQTEQVMFTGTASQTGSSRWGDYSSMMIDPDGCTFWYTTEYANPASQVFDKRWKTKFGKFTYPSCTPVGAGGTITGTVTVTPGGAPISGATITFGARSTTTNGSGVYSFLNIPAGTYPSISATKPGYSTASAFNIVVTDGGTTTQDFALSVAPTSACVTDTTQADYLTGVPTNVDLTTSPGDVTLNTAAEQNTAGTTTGTGFGTPGWTGQTFIPALSGQLAKAEIQVFCSGCGATPPDLTLSVRNTAAGLPTGADIAGASVTILGSNFASGATVTFMATFGAPPAVTSGTQYALILRPVAVPAGSGYFWIRSMPGTYASGSRVLSGDSGGTWATDTARDYNFKAYIQGAYAPPSGNLVSSTKDSNPAGGLTPIWSNLSWNGTTPANTTLELQVAGSNNPGGPFTFVGPDGTAGTFFTTSPGSLGVLYNLRHAKYKAYLATTDNAVTPVLNDVTMCFNNVDCSVPISITPTPAIVCPSSAGNTASGPAGATSYAWSITNGTITSATNIQSITYTAGPSGNVGLTLNIVEPGGCQKSANINVPIDVPPAQPTITGNTSFCTGSSTTLTSSSATGNQWYLNSNPIGGANNPTYVVTTGNAGDYTVQVTDAAGCTSPVSAITTVTENPLPPAPTASAGGATTFCAGGSVTLTSSSATGNQWYDGVNPIGGETNPTYVATTSGSYNVKVTDGNGCTSAASNTIVVTVNPLPPTPTASAGGATTFCTGGSVTLTSSSATGNQWYDGVNPIGGATNSTYVATTSGNYNVKVTDGNGCTSAASNTVVVTVNPIPPQPTISGGPTTFCAGGSVTLTSSSATGNQWYINGNPIGGATNQTYVASVAGDYTVVVTQGGCSSAASATTTVTVNPNPNATITAPSSVSAGSTGNAASVANAGVGATYVWIITNGTITAGAGTENITFTAGVVGTLTLQCTVTTAAGCSDTKSANVNVVALPPVTVTSVVPAEGKTTGGKNVTVNGTNFANGATITFGGSLATNVVFVNSTMLTAKTPAHAAGFVNVTVTNPDTSNGTLINGYKYVSQQFDANGDNVIDPADIFWLVNYIFLGGPAPAGASGVDSGDANGDGVVDPADIFYLVNYLFLGGPAPAAETPRVLTQSVERMSGAVILGQPFLRGGRYVVPVSLSAGADSAVPQALSLRAVFSGDVRSAVIHRAGAVRGVDPAFEISRRSPDALVYLLAFDERKGGFGLVPGAAPAVIAEIEIEATSAARLSIEVDPQRTLLSNQSGTSTATVAAGTLRIRGTSITSPRRQQPDSSKNRVE